MPTNKDPRAKAKTPVTLSLLHTLTCHLKGKYLDKNLEEPGVFLALRDTIILNMSFFGLLRRSDAAGLHPSSIQYDATKRFALAHIAKSKTDQIGEGYTLPLILSNSSYEWSTPFGIYLAFIHDKKAVLFPSYNAKSKDITYTKPLTLDGIGKVLTNRVAELVKANIIQPIPNLSSHSLRRGGATYLRT